MSGLLSDLRYALRALRKSPAFTFTGVGMLALGIGANTTIFTALESFLLRPLPLKNPERLVFVQQVRKTSGETFVAAYPDFLEWRRTPGVFEGLAGLAIETFNVSGAAAPERVRGCRVTTDFFRVMGFAPQYGRGFTAADDAPAAAPVVVLSNAYWTRHFGADPKVVGRSVVIDGKAHTIAGVMPAALRFPMGFSELWTPLATSEARNGRGDHFLAVVGRLREGMEPTDARSRLDATAQRLEEAFPESNRNMGIRLVLLQEQITQGPKRALFVLFGVAALVLMICCANLANLMLARAMHRGRETAIRLAIGASAWRLIRQTLVESVLLSTAGGCGGLLLAAWGVELLNSSLPPMLQPLGGITMDTRVLAFSIAVSVATGVLFGLAPALRVRRDRPADALRAAGQSSAASFGRSPLTSALVIGEIALATVLLIGAGLLIDAGRRIRTADLGYDPRHVLTAEIAPKTAKFADPRRQMAAFDAIVGRLNATPGVVAASAVNWPPMTNNTRKAIAVEGQRMAQNPPLADYRIATPLYARAMGIAILKGRFIADSDQWTTEPVAVVNERLARAYWPNQDPIGKRLAVFIGPGKTGPWRTVVGVAGDVRHSRPAATPVPEIYLPVAQTGAGQLYLAIRTAGDPAGFARTLESVVHDVDAQLPLNLVRPMEQVIADGVAADRMVTLLFSLFSFVAIVLAAMGLYGVISYLVARRIHEFGIRLALGATARDLLRLVLRRSIALTLAGTTVGLAGGLGMARVLAAVFEGVRPAGSVFATVAAVLAAAAVTAAWIPLRRALSLDPLSALREQ
ncbi:MAG: ABC transporter permease [Acidobacteria bacterium]|nr:ABC transporter permease [Acidobacteriota bacterium]